MGKQQYSDSLYCFHLLLTSDREDYALACTLWQFVAWNAIQLEGSIQCLAANELIQLALHVFDDSQTDENGSNGSSNAPIVLVDKYVDKLFLFFMTCFCFYINIDVIIWLNMCIFNLYTRFKF